ncbi:hypothetical protein ACFOEK_20800 [Litoribrevibacter euphylliae]|uniref:Uncharacterized protein n=1 Tax=Litoribrevibacter euphylliae TaxID=1834034 RepID=A0ABV7HPT9_9GAMM
MVFQQKRIALSIESEILPNGVRIKEKDLFNTYETVIPYEHISDQVIKSFNLSKLYLIICVFFGALFLINIYDFYFYSEGAGRPPATSRDILFSLVWFLLASFGTWMRSVKYIGIACAGGNLFFLDVKGKQDPEKYLNQILHSRDFYFQSLGHPEIRGQNESADTVRH